MHILTKRGNLDNIITYEHICDTTEDMAFIEQKYITLGSTCVVLQGDGGGMEVYMADSNKEWHDIMVTGGNEMTTAGLELHVCTAAEVQNGKPNIETPLESTLYLVPSGSESGNLYDEYVYVNQQWELFGGARVNMNGYATESWVQQQGYLTRVPHATESDYGTIKLGAGLAQIVDAQGHDEGIGVLLAPNSLIKQGTETDWAVPVSGTGAAAFYGLAKAAGDTTQAQSSNAVGTYTDAAKTAIQEMLDVPSNDAIPTKVSDLTNDSGFITSFTETDPTVSAWAKAASKPTYTAAEVGAPTTQEMNSAIATAIGNSPIESGTGVGSIQTKQYTFNNDVTVHTQSATGDGSIAIGIDTFTSGMGAFAEGEKTVALAEGAHAEGCYTAAAGEGAAHAEGYGTIFHATVTSKPEDYVYVLDLHGHLLSSVRWGMIAEWNGQYAEIGNVDVANNSISIYENWDNVGDTINIYLSTASGWASHIEGVDTFARYDGPTHAEGLGAAALAEAAHAEGWATVASGTHSHAEGSATIADSDSQHVSGKFNIVDSDDTYAEIVGNGTDASTRSNARTLDWNGNAWYAGTVSAGTVANPASVTNANDLATKAYVDAIGNSPIESGTGTGSIQSKQFTVTVNNTDETFAQSASGEGAIALGAGANASGFAAAAIGVYTIASGECSFAEGDSSEAIGNMSHAEGSSTFASGGASHAEGVGDCIYYEITAHPSTYTYQFENLDEEVQNGWVVYDENSKQVYAIQNRTGDTVTLIGGNNFNVGDTLAFYSNAAYGEASHTEGYNTIALGNYSHAEGKLTKVLYDVKAAHAEGYGTVADAPYLHVEGTFNVYTGRHNYVHITGIGTSDENRANGFTVDNLGRGWFASTVSAGTSAEPASVNDPNDLTTKQYVDDALAAKVVSVEGTTPEVAADADTQYICGEVTTLSFTPAATGISDIIFESGSTATVLTIPNTVKFPEWFDATALEPNMVYEISIMNGTYGAVMAWATT